MHDAPTRHKNEDTNDAICTTESGRKTMDEAETVYFAAAQSARHDGHPQDHEMAVSKVRQRDGHSSEFHAYVTLASLLAALADTLHRYADVLRRLANAVGDAAERMRNA